MRSIHASVLIYVNKTVGTSANSTIVWPARIRNECPNMKRKYDKSFDGKYSKGFLAEISLVLNICS